MHTARFLAAAIALVSLIPFACAEEAAAPAVITKAEPWVRLQEDEDRTLRLEIAMRTYSAPGRPDLVVAGAVHIGDRPYYRALQEVLDANDIVLFEGVKPSAAGPDDATITDAQRVERTKGRIRLIGILIERYKLEHDDALPGSLDECAQAMAGDARHLRWLQGASIDAWGNPIVYRRASDVVYEVTSLGADAKPGGKGWNADLRLSDDKPITPAELGLTPGLQEKLAETFRLRFQLTEMDESKPNWRNADLSIEQINERLADAGESGDFLFTMLDGSSGLAAFASGLLTAMQAIPGAAPRGKLMIMELLSLSDEDTMGASMPGGEELMKVIIEDRNQAVVDHLQEVIELDPGVQSVGIVYGAGHMPDLIRRLEAEFGYQPSGETVWNTAMRLPLEKLGITPEERMMVRYSVLQQIAAAKRAQAAKD